MKYPININIINKLWANKRQKDAKKFEVIYHLHNCKMTCFHDYDCGYDYDYGYDDVDDTSYFDLFYYDSLCMIEFPFWFICNKTLVSFINWDVNGEEFKDESENSLLLHSFWLWVFNQLNSELHSSFHFPFSNLITHNKASDEWTRRESSQSQGIFEKSHNSHSYDDVVGLIDWITTQFILNSFQCLLLVDVKVTARKPVSKLTTLSAFNSNF